MKAKLIFSTLVIASLISNPLLADPETARKQAVNNAKILYESADPKSPNNWGFYFGPTEQVAATNAVANKKRSVMQSYFLDKKFPSKQIQRSVSWLFDASINLQMYEYGVIPSEPDNDTISESDNSTPNNYGY